MLQPLPPQKPCDAAGAHFQTNFLLSFGCNISSTTALWKLSCHVDVLLCISICFERSTLPLLVTDTFSLLVSCHPSADELATAANLLANFGVRPILVVQGGQVGEAP